jgi:hypothetical protein
MHTVRRMIERLGILLPCGYVGWLAFIDPTYSALNDDEPLLIAALAVSIAAALLFAACAVSLTWTKFANQSGRATSKP